MTPVATNTSNIYGKPVTLGDMGKAFDSSGNVATPTTNTQAVTTVQPTPIVPPPPVTPGSTANDTTAKVTPIVSANAAMEHYTNAQNLLNTTQQGMTQQAQNAQAAQANAGQQVTTDTTKGANQPVSQPANSVTGATTPDNSDLTGALKGATDALNGGEPVKAPEENITPAEKQTGQRYSDIQSQIDTATSNFTTAVSQIQAGVFPLNPQQQATLNLMNTSVQNLINSAQQQAQQYKTAATTFSAIHNLGQFNPGSALQAISAAMAEGQAKISTAEMNGTKALSDLQKSFQDEDFDMLSKSYDALQNSLDKKTSLLDKLNDQISKQVSQALEQHKSDMADAKVEYDKQQAAQKFAADNQITKPFYLVGNTAINTKTGEAVSLEDYQRLTGQQVGLPEDQTDFSQIQKAYLTPEDRKMAQDQAQFDASLNEKKSEFAASQKLDYAKLAQSATTQTNLKDASPELISAIAAGTIDPNRVNSRTIDLYNKIAQANVDTVSSHAGVEAKTNAYKDTYGIKTSAERLVGVVDKQVPIVASLADEVNTTGVPGLDNLINSGKAYTGNDPAVGKYINAIITLRNEYANMLAKGTSPTESMREEANQAIPSGKDSAFYNSLGSQLKLEGENLSSVANDTLNNILPKANNGQGIKAPPTEGQIGKIGDTTYKFTNGQWVSQ